MRVYFLVGFIGLLLAASSPAETSTVTGSVQVKPGIQTNIPERYRLKELSFEYQLTPEKDYPLSGYRTFHLQFPSPVQSRYEENNTVHATYYRPHGKDKCPCVIVLDILEGSAVVARTVATHLAQNGIAALHVQMAYYGDRRPKGKRVRLLSYDLNHSMSAVRQTVLDLRCATAWMAAQPDIDTENLGITGISLGGFMTALTAEMEPRLKRVAILLAGGGFIDAYYDHPKAAPYRKMWETFGGTKELAKKLFAPVDPLTCAANLKSRQVMMLAARRDEIVPPQMAEALWKACGEPTIYWYNTTHYGAALYLPAAMKHVVEHFQTK